MALKQSIKSEGWALHEGFHESRAGSRLRLRRVSSGEWPERRERTEEVGKGMFREAH